MRTDHDNKLLKENRVITAKYSYSNLI